MRLAKVTIAGFKSFADSTGKLNAVPTDWNTGLLDAPGSDGDWDQNEKLVYRVTVSVDDVPAAEGQTTGAHTLRWEARNL